MVGNHITMFVELMISLLVSPIVLILISTIVQQFKANQYFKKVSPRLPIPYELISLFDGHARNISLSQNNIYVINALHRKYGKTFGHYYCKKPWVSTIDLELIKAIVVDEPYANLNRTELKIPIKELEIDTIALAEVQQWKRLRKVYAAGLANHKIKHSENVSSDLESIISELKESIEEKLEKADKGNDRGAVVNISDMMNRFSLALVFKSFYKQQGLVDFKSNKDYYSNIIERFYKFSTTKLVILPMVFPFLIQISQWIVVHLTEYGLAHNGILDFIWEQTRQNLNAKRELAAARKQPEVAGSTFNEDNFTLQNGSTFKRNLVDPIIESFHMNKINKQEFINSSYFLFHASQRTCADAFTMLIYHLASDQKVQDKLRESILRDAEKSEYLDWCIHESLRLIPPVTGGCSRTVEKDYFTKEGILIPKGTFVLTSTYSINRSVEYWGEDANEFKPDRWSNWDNFHPVQFLSFGYGPRNCIGKHFAMYSTQKLMSALLSHYKFSITPETSTNTRFKSQFFIYNAFENDYFIRLTKITE